MAKKRWVYIWTAKIRWSEKALQTIAGKKIETKGAGRTDRGVHALDQKVTFNLDLNISPEKIKKILNNLVKPYIFVNSICVVPSYFHPRFNTIKKEYVYIINNGKYNPLKYDYELYFPYKLDYKLMKKCAKEFIGIHNFKNFVSGERNNYECIIYAINFKKYKNKITIKFTGQSFYRYMVRNLVGAILDVGRGKAKIEDVKKALKNCNKPIRFSTASPNGLYLNKIYYE